MSCDINMQLTKQQQRQKQADQLAKLAESRGFTIEYQEQKENDENVKCRKKRTPATENTYAKVVEIWCLWRLSRNEPEDKNFAQDQPDPSAQTLKIFAEFYITSRKELPSQYSVCHLLHCFFSEWGFKTDRVLPENLKKDVQNHIINNLTPKHNLPVNHRKKNSVTKKDLDHLLRRPFEDDDHDYPHEIIRVYLGFTLSLFSGSGTRAGAVVESSAYRGTNECLYYKHLVLSMKWTKTGGMKYWVTIDQEFLKGKRYKKDAEPPMNWIPEQKTLGRNFPFWLMAIGLADKAFKDIGTLDKLLEIRPCNGRESLSFEWKESVKNLPVLRMVTADGPHKARAMTFSSLRHHYTSLAKRDGFRDILRIHGIRGGVANAIDPNATRETRSQALDHQNPDTFHKYQSKVKAMDIQASFWGLEPDLECLEMEQSMTHHRDTNMPQHLSSMAIAELEKDPEMIDIKQRIVKLTEKIDKQPQNHEDLVQERTKLYGKAAKKRRAKINDFIAQWWKSSYSEYITGCEFAEQDPTCLFNIYRKYMPERDRLREELFTEASIHSEIGRQCLQDAISLSVSEKKVAYYPGELPVKGQCPVCSKEMSSIALQRRSKHILQCRRKQKNASPYQQRYQNGKRAHRRVGRSFLEFCYLCAEWFSDEAGWKYHCISHLNHLHPRCGLLTFRYTLVAPGFCPFCLGDDTKEPDERFQQWREKTTLINHIDKHIGQLQHDKPVQCPHPWCDNKEYANCSRLLRHFFDRHSIEEPRSNCVARKRRWNFECDVTEGSDPKKALLEPDNAGTNPAFSAS